MAMMGAVSVVATAVAAVAAMMTVAVAFSMDQDNAVLCVRGCGLKADPGYQRSGSQGNFTVHVSSPNCGHPEPVAPPVSRSRRGPCFGLTGPERLLLRVRKWKPVGIF
jgi:hypothetical protein